VSELHCNPSGPQVQEDSGDVMSDSVGDLDQNTRG
jgi:hypothetical protein